MQAARTLPKNVKTVENPAMGQSIGVAGMKSTGTLGGYVVARDTGKVYALTNGMWRSWAVNTLFRSSSAERDTFESCRAPTKIWTIRPSRNPKTLPRLPVSSFGVLAHPRALFLNLWNPSLEAIYKIADRRTILLDRPWISFVKGIFITGWGIYSFATNYHRMVNQPAFSDGCMKRMNLSIGGGGARIGHLVVVAGIDVFRSSVWSKYRNTI